MTQTLHHCTVQIHLGMKWGLPCVVEKQQSECGYHTSRQSLHSSFYSKATREMWVWMIVALHVASHLGIYPPYGAGILSGRSPNEMSSVGLASLGLGRVLGQWCEMEKLRREVIQAFNEFSNRVGKSFGHRQVWEADNKLRVCGVGFVKVFCLMSSTSKK